jgi:hypothetical protein
MAAHGSRAEEVAQLTKTGCADHPIDRRTTGYAETSLMVKGTWSVRIGFMSYADTIVVTDWN